MEPRTFQAHINLLVSKRYPVIKLKEALQLLDKKTLPPCPVVITFDDGFKTIKEYAIPILSHNALPSTIFLTTYYCIKAHPVFRLAVQYMFWKTRFKDINLTGIDLPMSGRVSLNSVENRQKVAWQIIDYAEKELPEEDRQRIASELGFRLKVPYSELVNSGALSIMTAPEIQRIASGGTDIQLHTHRHNFPENPLTARTEIRDNRAVLEPIIGKELGHFCYPSGVWSERHFPILRQENIESAVTCDTGFNYADTPRFSLRRFLDGQHISNIEFEAELSGLMEIMRKMRSAAQAIFCRPNSA